MTNAPHAVPLPAAFLRPIAHRGLHDTAAGVIENTGPAFAAAIEAGYAIECDLQPGAVGRPLVFHDATLDRVTDHTGPLAGLGPVELARVRHSGSGAPILSFAEFLDLIAGRVPLVVEVKSRWEPANPVFLSTIGALASAYSGPIALMSFDPAVVGALARIAPAVPRGLASGSYIAASGDGWWQEKLTPARSAALRELAEHDPVGASFAGYEVGALPSPACDAIRARGQPVLAWTVRTAGERALAASHADAMIFEGFRP